MASSVLILLFVGYGNGQDKPSCKFVYPCTLGEKDDEEVKVFCSVGNGKTGMEGFSNCGPIWITEFDSMDAMEKCMDSCGSKIGSVQKTANEKGISSEAIKALDWQCLLKEDILAAAEGCPRPDSGLEESGGGDEASAGMSTVAGMASSFAATIGLASCW